DHPAEPRDRPAVVLGEDDERVTAKHIAKRGLGRRPRDPPAQHPAEGRRVCDADRFGRVPELVLSDPGAAAMAGPYLRAGQPTVDVDIVHYTFVLRRVPVGLRDLPSPP